ncbi:DUF1957 domain-containing protein [bacterium]|nr:DUF1957 domain-containing protein [bacterium]
MNGYLQIVLHSHLPYVLTHGRWPHGADWIFEAAAETYIPIIQILKNAENENIPLRFSIGISPVLAEQLAHPLFAEQFVSYIRLKLESAQDDQRYFLEIGDEHRMKLAQMWDDFYTKILHDFQEIDGDIVGAFRRYREKGFIEILTCAATHGYLPLLGTDNSVYAQLAIAKQVHRKHFGVDPDGIWLPEAAYRPRYDWVPPVGKDKTPLTRRGIEEFLYHLDIHFFIVDSHLLKGGKAIGVYIDRFEALKKLWAQFEKEYEPREEIPRSPYQPYLCSSTGGKFATPFFVRDPETGLQVWSGEWGYTGNPAYLDFHKKHFPGGHRYWRVTDSQADLADKELYHPEWIADTISEQSHHFANLCAKILNKAEAEQKVPPIITAPFDTELFGHWWFEGPKWLLEVARQISEIDGIEMTGGWSYLEKYPPDTVVQLPEGSWGQGGFHYIWLNEWTMWTWEHIYEAEKEMINFANRWVEKGGDYRLKRALVQMGKELLLLESSDWQFLISTWSARDYAERRIVFHYEKFKDLVRLARELIDGKEPPDGWMRELEILERQDDIFGDIDPALWADKNLDF